jgi:hypothetical protein
MRAGLCVVEDFRKVCGAVGGRAGAGPGGGCDNFGAPCGPYLAPYRSDVPLCGSDVPLCGVPGA